MSAKMKFIVIILVIIAIIVIARKTDLINRIKRLFEPRYIDYNCNPTGGTKDGRVSNSRIPYLNSMAQQIYDDIHNTPYSGHNCSIYEEANLLCDEELAYVAQQYRKALTRGTSIYSDLDTQWTIVCDFDTLRAHLAKVGET